MNSSHEQARPLGFSASLRNASKFGLRAFDDVLLISIRCIWIQLAKHANTVSPVG